VTTDGARHPRSRSSPAADHGPYHRECRRDQEIATLPLRGRRSTRRRGYLSANDDDDWSPIVSSEAENCVCRQAEVLGTAAETRAALAPRDPCDLRSSEPKGAVACRTNSNRLGEAKYRCQGGFDGYSGDPSLLETPRKRRTKRESPSPAIGRSERRPGGSRRAVRPLSRRSYQTPLAPGARRTGLPRWPGGRGEAPFGDVRGRLDAVVFPDAREALALNECRPC
jgi:hypothetical protein